MPKLEIAGFAEFTVSLDEIAGAARLILANTKDAKVRSGLKNMFTELRKANAGFTQDVLVPLMGIQTQTAFDTRFGKIREKFKSHYLGHGAWLSQVNCHTVTAHLKKLRDRKAWRKDIPLLGRSFRRLDRAAEQWVKDDSKMYEADQAAMKQVNRFLDRVAALQRSDPEAAFAALLDGLRDIENTYVLFQKYLAALDGASATI